MVVWLKHRSLFFFGCFTKATMALNFEIICSPIIQTHLTKSLASNKQLRGLFHEFRAKIFTNLNNKSTFLDGSKQW